MLYYDGDALDEIIEELLIEDLGEDELGDLELSNNIEKEVVIKSGSVDGGNIILTVKVSGYVMPQLDEDDVAENLVGKGWAEGLKYLKKLEYVTGDPDVEFYPEWFPQFMKHMPNGKNKITVNVNNVVPEEDGGDEGGEESEDGNSESTE